MANILKIQDQLKGLPDNALVKYAQNPTGDVPQYLVLGELQRRKTMREEFQQSQTQAPQTTVADDLAGLAAMRPQMQQPQPESGIANLPIPDTMFQEQNMAGGGIVAFAGGGGTSERTSSVLGRTIGPSEASNIQFDALMAGRRGYEARLAQISARMAELSGFAGLRQQTPAEQREYETLKAERDRINSQMGSLKSDISKSYDFKPTTPTASPATQPAPAAPAPAPAAPTASAVSIPAVPREPTLPQVPEFKPTLLETEGARKALLDAQDMYSPKAIKERRQAEREAAGIKDVYASQMEELSKEREGLKGKKDEAINMALIEAGLGMMAGTSPFALTNIGAGAARGVASLKEAQKELNQAQRELRREGNSLARAQQDTLEARLRGDQDAVDRGQDRVIQAQGRLEEKADKNAMLENSAMQFNIGKQFDRNLAVYSSQMADVRLSKQLAADATKFNQQMRMYEKRIEASDRNTAARLQANRTAALANMYKDPDYQNFLADLDERYKKKQGSANPSYQFEKQNYTNKYLSTALGLTMEGGSARSAESLLED